jgi:hypothetical protein
MVATLCCEVMHGYRVLARMKTNRKASSAKRNIRLRFCVRDTHPLRRHQREQNAAHVTTRIFCVPLQWGKLGPRLRKYLKLPAASALVSMHLECDPDIAVAIRSGAWCVDPKSKNWNLK